MIYPPRIEQDFDYSLFADGLHEIIPDKITKIISDMEEMEEKYFRWKKVIKNLKLKGELNEFGVYFWSVIAEMEFVEYEVSRKWLTYWLRIYEKLPAVTMPKTKRKDFVDKKFEIERAKQQPIENFYEGNLRATGPRLYGLCPFHEEKRASFFIFTNNNTYHCFGCAASGDVIDFVMKTRKVDFKEAMRILL